LRTATSQRDGGSGYEIHNDLEGKKVAEYAVDISVEASLDEIRAAAKRILKATKDLEATSRSLEQAAAKGEFVKLQSAVERAATLQRLIGEEVDQLRATWLLNDTAVEEVLEHKLMDEVAELLEEHGVGLHQYGSGWSASPVLLRLDAKSRTVKIDRTRLAMLRPSVIATAVVSARQRPSARPDQFIELLHSAYRAAVGSISISDQPTRLGSSVPLSEVYKSLTLHPDSRREYSIESFTRDLFMLDRSGVATTKNGLRMFFSSSTSSKGGGGVLTVLDDAGAPQNYFAVAFREITT
jgi:hypothetical protein